MVRGDLSFDYRGKVASFDYRMVLRFVYRVRHSNTVLYSIRPAPAPRPVSGLLHTDTRVERPVCSPHTIYMGCARQQQIILFRRITCWTVRPT